MPRISELSTEVPNSTSDLVGNVGSTTRRFNAGQLIGAIFTSQGQMVYAASSNNSTFLNPPTSNALLSYSSGTSAPAWIVGSSGELWYVSSAGVSTALAAPTSGAVMVYSTANSSIGPRWEVPTSGATLMASSLGVPTWRALGTSGQVLQSTGGSPAWVDSNSLTGAITTAGTSGQVLQTTGGVAAWRGITSGRVLYGNSSGEVTELAAPTSGAVMTYSSVSSIPAWSVPTSGAVLIASSLGVPTWLPIGSSGQQLETTGGAPAWAAAGGAGTTHAWDITNATTQAVSTVGVALNFDIENVDSENAHSTSVNSSLVTVPTSGRWLIGAKAAMQANGLALRLIVFEGGSSVVAISWFSSVTGDQAAGSISALHYYATSGASLTLQARALPSADSVLATPSLQFWGHRLS